MTSFRTFCLHTPASRIKLSSLMTASRARWPSCFLSSSYFWIVIALLSVFQHLYWCCRFCLLKFRFSLFSYPFYDHWCHLLALLRCLRWFGSLWVAIFGWILTIRNHLFQNMLIAPSFVCFGTGLVFELWITRCRCVTDFSCLVLYFGRVLDAPFRQYWRFICDFILPSYFLYPTTDHFVA